MLEERRTSDLSETGAWTEPDLSSDQEKHLIGENELADGERGAEGRGHNGKLTKQAQRAASAEAQRRRVEAAGI